MLLSRNISSFVTLTWENKFIQYRSADLIYFISLYVNIGHEREYPTVKLAKEGNSYKLIHLSTSILFVDLFDCSLYCLQNFSVQKACDHKQSFEFGVRFTGSFCQGTEEFTLELQKVFGICFTSMELLISLFSPYFMVFWGSQFWLYIEKLPRQYLVLGWGTFEKILSH